MIETGALQALVDFTRGTFQCAPLAGTRGGDGVAREELQLGGPRSERGELEDETGDRAGGGRLLESRPEWRGDARGVGRRILEEDVGVQKVERADSSPQLWCPKRY